MTTYRVLVVDDEPSIRFAVRDFLESKGLAVDEAESCERAVAVFGAVRPDVAVLDYRLPDGTALELIPRLRTLDASVPLVVLTAHGSIELAVRAIKEGAEQFLTKPVELPALFVILDRLLENRRNRQRQLARKSRQQRETVDPFVGESAGIRALADAARRVVTSDTPVLILGETGTGKGVLARWLHTNGPRADDAFVDLNCAGLSRELLDSELFGYERGAFTSAVKQKTGLLEVAHGGTVFLDEIGDMDPGVQAKLLKVLEEQRFRRLGDVRDRTVDIRLIAATHQDLRRIAAEGRFRNDLYYRINTIQLTVPPLRARREDIVPLARVLLRELAADLGRADVRLAPDAEQGLETYGWPGNVRQLRNVLERALLLSDSHTLTRRSLRFDDPAHLGDGDLDEGLTLRDLEIRHIERVLEAVHGHVASAAQRLGVPKSSLYQKLKTYGIEPSRFRTSYPGAGRPPDR